MGNFAGITIRVPIMTDIPKQSDPYTTSNNILPMGATVSGRSIAHDVPHALQHKRARKQDGSAPEVHMQPFQDITLEDGKTVRVASSRADEMEHPLHVGVTSNPPSTPGYFRFLMPLLTARYVPRFATNTMFGFDHHNPEKKDKWWHIPNNIAGWIDNVASKDATLLENFISKVTDNGRVEVGTLTHETLGKNKEYVKVIDMLQSIGQTNNPEKNLLDFCNQYIELHQHKLHANELEQKAVVHLTELPSNYFHFEDQVNKPGNNFEENLGLMKKKMRSNLQGFCFDSALGIGSLAITLIYGAHVWKDIHKTFAETVAYEQYKDPENVQAKDIFLSDNKIVQETWHEFVVKNAWRLGTDALFFGRNAGYIPHLGSLKDIPFGEIGIGAKGVLLMRETQRKTTSILTDITDMIDRKLNPQHGLGDPLRASDFLDIHQKCNLLFRPNAMLKDATKHDMQDSADWRLSNAIFTRIADLSNNTYKYKHGFTTHDDPLEELTQEILSEKRYFAFPKYLYLEGHDLIDLREPAKTLAYVEIANRYSIQAVKDVRVLLEDEKIPLEKVLQTYPVDLQRTLNGSTSPELIAISEKARAIDRAEVKSYFAQHPDYKEKYDRIVADKAAAAQNAQAASTQPVSNNSYIGIPSFFPAQTDSLPQFGNDTAPPSTKITEHSQASRIVPELVVQKS